MNAESMNRSIVELDIEILKIHELLDAIIASHPNQRQVLASFQAGIESLSHNAPAGLDPERIVELRARASMHLIALGKRLGSNG